MKKTAIIFMTAAIAISSLTDASAFSPIETVLGEEIASGIIIRGKVVDKTTGEPETGAVIQFFKASDMEKPVAYTITDTDGSFVHGIEAEGEYVMLYTNVGRKEVRKTFKITKGMETDLGTIEAEDDIEMLEAGQIVALKDLVKMEVDRVTYKVSDDIDAKTSTLLDMLRKVPMVTVDAQDNITVNGSSSFQVLMDGKPNVMMSSNPSQVFKAIPASFVKDIQVVTNPGVKYDAEGVGGILNITTNKEQGGSAELADGYNGSVSLGGGTRGLSGSGFMTMQKGKFSASANISLSQSKIPGTIVESTSEQLDVNGNVLSSIKTIGDSELKAPVRMATIDMGYEINEENLISATFGLSSLASHSLTKSTTEHIISGLPIFSYSNNTNQVWDINSITGGIDYQRSFKDKEDKSFILSYLFSSSPSDTDSETIFDTALPNFVNRYTDGSTNTIQNTIQADFNNRLNSALVFNTGAKYTNRANKSDQALFMASGDSFIQDLDGSMIYRHLNNIAAGYAELSFAKDKWSGKGGLRYEHTFQNVEYKLGNGKDFKMNYGHLVPAASVQYSISPLQNVGLNYNMRISRPGITYLNPYVDISDPSMKKYGNSELETEKAHNVGLVYNIYAGNILFNASAHYTYTGNSIASYSFYDADGLLNSTYGNISKSNIAGLTSMLMLNIGKTRFIMNGGVDYVDQRSSVLKLQHNGWSGNALASLQTSLPWDVRLSSNMIWRSKSHQLDGYSTGISILTGGLTKTFLSDKLSVSVNGITPLTFSKYMETQQFNQGQDYRITASTRIPLSMVMANITWTFGNKQNASVKKTRKSITNDDVKDRSNNQSAGLTGI